MCNERGRRALRILLVLVCSIALAAGARAATGDRLNRTGFVGTFSEDFQRPISFFNPRTGKGRWKTNFDFGDQSGPSSRSLKTELEIYSDASYNGVNPFRRSRGQLTITASANTAPSDPRSAGKPFTSGLLTTTPSFRQRYGYFELRGALPQGAGVWPAFWMAVPLDPSVSAPQFPGEIDIMELLGRQPHVIYCSAHWPLDARSTKAAAVTKPVSLLTTDQIHSYGVLWTARSLIWYVDDAEVTRMANPGLHRAMTILVDLAIGGKWGGPPDHATPFPAMLTVSHIEAYRLPGKHSEQ